MTSIISAIYRHPVKGLTPEEREQVILSPSQAIPNDRRFALALGTTRVDGTVSEWMAKSNYLMLMRDERMAQLQTEFDDETDTLTVFRGGRQVARGNLTQKIGRTVIEDFFQAFMKEESRGRPKLVEAAEGHALSDHDSPVISIINLASLKDMARVLGTAPDARRFRGNFIIEGMEPWAEFDLVGWRVKAGEAILEVTERIDRCGATNVDPDTAERDLNIPKALMRGYGHIECGIFARVIEGGTVRKGDPLERI